MTSLHLDEAAADKASEISVALERRGESIEVRDLSIGAIARTSRLPLVTKNIEHFRRIPNLDMVTPSDLLKKVK